MQEICTSGLMRGHWKRGMGEMQWHRRETRRTTEKTNFTLNHRASALLYRMPDQPQVVQRNSNPRCLPSRIGFQSCNVVQVGLRVGFLPPVSVFHQY